MNLSSSRETFLQDNSFVSCNIPYTRMSARTQLPIAKYSSGAYPTKGYIRRGHCGGKKRALLYHTQRFVGCTCDIDT